MYRPRAPVRRFFFFLQRYFAENRARKWQVALLMLFFTCLWWMMGVTAGAISAFFVYFFTPDGPERGWPAMFAFVGIALGTGLFGTVKSWQLYRAKIAEIAAAEGSLRTSAD